MPASARSASAASADSQKTGWRFAVESEPYLFAFGGYSGYVAARPAGPSHWRFGLGSFGLPLPDSLVNSDPANSGWSVRKQAYLVEADYYFGDKPWGGFVGSELGLMQTFISRADSPGQTATEYQALVIPRIGYKWYPFSAGLYVMPWLGVGLFPTVAGSSTVGGKAFKDMLLQPQPEIELGYEF